ncbi:helix-turn-helix domain-containing protein [Rhodococcus sp. T2V]|uniref:helix-turn-helix domain-containing protein n=1 Tax=Rhodococcus sp. T2V TaxID=3034164 RepID=UPI0023E18826|nr:helix-turn-helix domain-containing protein [Rhodococcus sp. T2V]MDF3310005.1 helix-turn-helix domain-containing protein [Rhodococcus sp. T2V]
MTATTSERAILRQCTELLRGLLPEDWDVRSEAFTNPSARGSRSAPARADGRLRITPPDGDAADFLVEVKRVLNRRDIGVVVGRLGNAADDTPGQGLVMARYISPPLQELLRERSLSYIDATGNVMVTARRPAMVLRDRGASQDPFRGPGRPRATLKGEPAARLIRTLTREQGPWSARELVARSGVSTGATYRVLELLQEEELVSRTADKRFEVTDWPQLLRRWSRDYSFVDNTQTYQLIDPRGVPALLKRLAKDKVPGFRYAVTGSVAAAEWAPYAPARAAFIYTDNLDEAARKWRLHPVDPDTAEAANVILGEPEYSVVFENTSRAEDGYTIAAIEQVAVDLLSGPGRNPAEGEELIGWMQAHESAWRR